MPSYPDTVGMEIASIMTVLLTEDNNHVPWLNFGKEQSRRDRRGLQE